MNNPIQNLEQLVDAVERAGANIAPSYQEYMPLAFAIANDCGEAGRPLFHRICRLSEKYRRDDAEKMYTNAIKTGHGKNTLGTVWHLAETAGVDVRNLSFTSNPPSHVHDTYNATRNASERSGDVSARFGNTSEQSRDASERFGDASEQSRNASERSGDASERFGNTSAQSRDASERSRNAGDQSRDTSAHSGNAGEQPDNSGDGEAPENPPPPFPEYRWPRFLQQAIDCGESKAQRDILLLGVVTVLGATLNRLVRFNYGHKDHFPCLQTFILALPASGKGALAWARQLAEPIHREMLFSYGQKMKTFRTEKNRWDYMGKERANHPEPEQPHRRLFFIAGDNSGTGIQENLMDNDGEGLICESEADTVSAAIGADYGHWSHTLRNAFDHDRLAYNRRTNREYRECGRLLLGVLLSGTPAQLCPLIPSPENGLFSRQLFYYMPPIREWVSQFDTDGTDYGQRFLQWGEQWKTALDAVKAETGGFRLQLSAAQQEAFDLRLAQLFSHAGAAHGSHMRSTVARIAVNVCRIMSVVAWLRSLETVIDSVETGGLETGFAETGSAETGTSGSSSLKPDSSERDSVEQGASGSLTSGSSESGFLERGSSEHAPSMNERLRACPGLSPCAHIPCENLADGMNPSFLLAVTPEDFEAVMNLVEPLYRHSCHVLMYLPDTGVSGHKASPREIFLSSLPMQFTRKEAMEVARRNGIGENTSDTLLRRMGEKGVIESAGRGRYRFTSRVRVKGEKP